MLSLAPAPQSPQPQPSPEPARCSTHDKQPSRRILKNGDVASTSTSTKCGRTQVEDTDNDEDTDLNTAGPLPPVPITSSSMSKLEHFEICFKTAERTPEQVLNTQCKTQISTVYKHFTDPPKIKVELTKIVYLFQCGFHPSIVIARAQTDESTSNLNCHVKACVPASSAQLKALTFFLQEIHAFTKEHLKKELAGISGKVHLAADGWTVPNVYSFIGATIHYIKDGELKLTVLDFIKLTKAHLGVYLAARIAECVQDWGLKDKIMAFVGDNTSNNDTLVQELKELVLSFHGQEHQVRCFAHVLNLVAGAILSLFTCKQEDKDDTTLNGLEDDTVLGDEEYDLADNGNNNIAQEVAQSDASQVLDAITEAGLDGRLMELSAVELSMAKVAITKLWNLASKISNSWDPFSMIKKDVSTHWNSTAELSQSGLGLCPALDRLVVQTEFNKPSGVCLCHFWLTEEEWKIIGQLLPMLNVIILTTYFNKDHHKVINDGSLHPAVRHAAMRGLKLLNKYYSCTDESIAYHIAMILHPHFKPQYFVKAKWDLSWIEEAKLIISEEWNYHYKPATLSSSSASTSLSTTSSCSEHFIEAHAHFNSIFESDVSVGDPLEEYLASPLIPSVVDPIQYWVGMQAAGHPLAQMALDYLLIPATSTDVERAFSRGGLTVSKLCHSLSDESTCCATVVSAWAKDDLVPIDDIVEVFKGTCEFTHGYLS
ncbi:hypothetical protein NMY22_g15875 [Coprinellus aureogranulatus]|nr:hypothetical protein NMY22_g15875 [Coprinellus aureogranulatus]